MTTLAELAAAARHLEASLPTPAALVLAEARAAGYSTRLDSQDPGVHRIYEPPAYPHESRVLVGMLVVREGVITYAEWHPGIGTATVYPMWPTDDGAAHESAVRALIDQIRDDRLTL